MPIPIPDALDESAALARTKAVQVRRLPRYLAASALAGAFVGVAVGLLASVAGPFVAAQAPSAKLVQERVRRRADAGRLRRSRAVYPQG